MKLANLFDSIIGVQWIASQPRSLLLNNQVYPLASYPVDNFLQYFEQARLRFSLLQFTNKDSRVHGFGAHEVQCLA